MIELLLIGAALLLIAKKRKSVNGIGRPYQTYLKFDDYATMPATPPTPVAPVVDEDIPDAHVLLYQDTEADNEWNAFEEEIFRAAQNYFEDQEEYELIHNQRYLDYNSIINDYMLGAEDAKREVWYWLPKAERKQVIADWIQEYLDDNLLTSEDAYYAGAMYIISKNSYL